MALHPDLLQILACPECHEHIVPIDNEQGLLCSACKVIYPVRENIPVMLVEESIPEKNWEEHLIENSSIV